MEVVELEDVTEFRKPGVDNEIHLNPQKATYYPDRFFELIAKHMVDRRVSGRARRRAVADAKRELLVAVRLIARRDRSNGTAEEDANGNGDDNGHSTDDGEER